MVTTAVAVIWYIVVVMLRLITLILIIEGDHAGMDTGEKLLWTFKTKETLTKSSWEVLI